MPRYDKCHAAVKNALTNDGWTITEDPLAIIFADARLFADIGAEKLFAAEKDSRKIAVEVKVFGSLSSYDDLEKAVGQYQIYRAFLRKIQPEREIYLAVAEPVYQKFFQRESVQFLVAEFGMKLLVFDEIKEEVVQWIS
ncbi:MAG: fatty-acid synthase [Acidobacteria bacterium]|nr:fatty-acid synthase [Acidobacteriota bacterium]